MTAQTHDGKRPMEVEIVRPLTVGTALVDLFSAIAILALTAWGLDILIAQLFPEFEISFWQIAVAIVFLRNVPSQTFRPRTVVR